MKKRFNDKKEKKKQKLKQCKIYKRKYQEKYQNLKIKYFVYYNIKDIIAKCLKKSNFISSFLNKKNCIIPKKSPSIPSQKSKLAKY